MTGFKILLQADSTLSLQYCYWKCHNTSNG